jgi:hypothetical protein
VDAAPSLSPEYPDAPADLVVLELSLVLTVNEVAPASKRRDNCDTMRLVASDDAVTVVLDRLGCNELQCNEEV